MSSTVLATAALAVALIALMMPSALAAPVTTPETSEWTYDARSGPAYWADLSTDFKACHDGQYQSPVNLHSGIESTTTGRKFPEWSMPPFVAGSMSVKNLGHTVQYSPEGNTTTTDTPLRGLRFGDDALAFKQFHFHTPSEHRINGQYYAGELHMVHKSADGKRAAVVGFLIDATEVDNPLFSQLLDYIPKNKSEPAAPLRDGTLDTTPFVAATKGDFFTYSGSLTTPPCTEGVTWLVPASPLQMSVKQLKKLEEVIGFTARPTQYNKEVDDAKSESAAAEH
ncbi:hypothetical protein GGF31_008103 [Allomyces arbusculus]|nr:hypothetical protein GGF31_008103 [Allomyces arbusculus]